ncbi:MAG: hypothetical protein GY895_07105 [Phycisphaera sp.]|nr:hypothetical protein [Phycisphaera sp.]
MNLHENDKTERLRSVLKRMERSIDDARSRRTRTSSPESSRPADDSVVAGRPKMATNGFDPLDTPIADSKPVREPISSKPRVVRDETTMFDFNGPRLKAKAKRRSAS